MRRLAMIVTFLLAALHAQPISAHDTVVRNFVVLTRNVYSGGDFTQVFNALSLNQVMQASPQLLQSVQATDFPARAKALADEIQATKPHLIGLQEVALWRIQSPGDGPLSPATTVVFDFLQLLKAELAARNLNYKTLAVFNGFDIEMPGQFSDGFKDLRFTDRIVVLARNSHHFTYKNIRKGQYETNFSIPTGFLGSIVYPRGWISVDVIVDGKKFRFINTHLEAFSSSVRQAQLQELLDGRANTSMPVVMVGDMNFQPGGAGSVYGSVIAEGFKDAWVNATGGAPGPTCCQNANLQNTNSHLNARIDYVFVRGAIKIRKAELLGESPSDKTPGGLWPSDHAGVLARLKRL